MATTIYYFTGTGNSLKVARDMAAALGGATLVSMAREADGGRGSESDVVGIVFPVYAWGPPGLVSRFLDRMRVKAGAYVFAVCTCGESAGGALVMVKKRLQRRGITVASGFVVVMPSNYIVFRGALPAARQEAIFQAAGRRMAAIAEVVAARRVREVDMGGAFSRVVTGLLQKAAAGFFPGQDRRFTVSAACNGCGLCEKICPAANIGIRAGRPEWRHRCEQCLACVQWCPREAINAGKRTVGRERYHHPEITAGDLAAASDG